MTTNGTRQTLRSRPALTRGVVAACLFTLAYLIGAIAGAVTTGNQEFIFYILVMVVLIGCVLLVHWRVRLSTGLIWCLAIWGATHMAGGLIPVPETWPINGEHRVLYSWWIISSDDGSGGWVKYDQVAHAYGFGVATWLCWQGLRGAVRRSTGADLHASAGILTLLALAGCGLGALNEIIEFTATRFTETNVGGYENTGWDLVANAAGSIAAAALIALGRCRVSPKARS